MDLRNDLQKLFQTLPGTVNELGETAASLPGVVDLRLFQLPDRTGGGGQFRHGFDEAETPCRGLFENFIFCSHDE